MWWSLEWRSLIDYRLWQKTVVWRKQYFRVRWMERTKARLLKAVVSSMIKVVDMNASNASSSSLRQANFGQRSNQLGFWSRLVKRISPMLTTCIAKGIAMGRKWSRSYFCLYLSLRSMHINFCWFIEFVWSENSVFICFSHTVPRTVGQEFQSPSESEVHSRWHVSVQTKSIIEIFEFGLWTEMCSKM